jgi:hypothetical protein
MTERKSTDEWARVLQEEKPLPARFVSSSTVSEGEGLKFVVDRFELVSDQYAKEDEEPRKFGEIEGTVLESRASRFEAAQGITVTCRSLRLEQLANEVPEIGDVILLIHGGFVGKVVNWKFEITRGAGELA